MNEFVFIDNKYIGTKDYRISDTKLDISYFASTRSQWLDFGFRLDISKKSGLFLLHLIDDDLDTWAYGHIPKALRWKEFVMGQPFDLDIRTGAAPEDCEIVEKYNYCYVDPNSEEWKQFLRNSNIPKTADEVQIYKFLVVFENFENLTKSGNSGNCL